MRKSILRGSLCSLDSRRRLSPHERSWHLQEPCLSQNRYEAGSDLRNSEATVVPNDNRVIREISPREITQ